MTPHDPTMRYEDRKKLRPAWKVTAIRRRAQIAAHKRRMEAKETKEKESPKMATTHINASPYYQSEDRPAVDYQAVRNLIASKIRELGRPVLASEVQGAHPIAVGKTSTKYPGSFVRLEAYQEGKGSSRWFIGFSSAIAAWETNYNAFGHLTIEGK